jgi:hypothetical protein
MLEMETYISEETKQEKENTIWGMLCQNCKERVIEIMIRNRIKSIFDLSIREYEFCSDCSNAIEDYFTLKQIEEYPELVAQIK